MRLIVGNSYRLTLKINNVTLTYTCKIIDIDDNFITLIDKFGKTFSYNLNTITSFEKIEEGGENGNRTY